MVCPIHLKHVIYFFFTVLPTIYLTYVFFTAVPPEDTTYLRESIQATKMSALLNTSLPTHPVFSNLRIQSYINNVN